MNLFKFFKKLFKKYYFKKDIFSSPNIINKKEKVKKPTLKIFEIENRYNQFYSSPAWKSYQQKQEMDIFLHRNKNIDVLTSSIERVDRIRAIIEGVLNGEIYYNKEEWYEKNKYLLWKYKNRREQSKH